MAYLPLKGEKVVIYARVSTDEDGIREQNPEIQINFCRELCEREGAIIIGEYRDKYTGTELARPGFKQLIGAIILEHPRALIVRDQSRLTRDNALSQITEITKSAGTAIVYAMTPDVDPNTLAGRVMDSFNGVMNQEFIFKLRAETVQGMKDAKEHGTHLGRPATFAIREDIENMPLGKIRTEVRVTPKGKTLMPTKILSEAVLYNYARHGHSVRFLAKMEGIPPSVVFSYLRGTKEPSIPGNPNSIIPERLSRYIALREECLTRRSPVPEDYEPECSERGIVDSSEFSPSDCADRGVCGKGDESAEFVCEKDVPKDVQ
ncbi:MAG: recombinase family protein [Thermoplasmata archaeon]|nr:recombinase family protein [Thermoplasmata archaeon]